MRYLIPLAILAILSLTTSIFAIDGWKVKDIAVDYYIEIKDYEEFAGNFPSVVNLGMLYPSSNTKFFYFQEVIEYEVAAFTKPNCGIPADNDKFAKFATILKRTTPDTTEYFNYFSLPHPTSFRHIGEMLEGRSRITGGLPCRKTITEQKIRHEDWDEKFFTKSGHYTLRNGHIEFGVADSLIWQTYTMEDWFNYMTSYAEVEFDIGQDILLDTSDVEITNLDTWKEWIPSMEGHPDSTNNQLKLDFRITGNNPDGYRLRVRLFDISWYPGRFTNDFVISYEDNIAYPDSLLNNEQWNHATSWLNCTDSTVADLKILNSLQTLHWQTSFQVSTHDKGYYESIYTQPLYDNSLVSITISSFDYAAKGKFAMELLPYDVPLPEEFKPNISYDRKLDGRESYILPIPRDEEYFAFGSYVVKTNGDTIYYYTLGDRLADEWEEFYCDDSTNTTHFCTLSGRDSLIYPNILFSKPYQDDSIEHVCFFEPNIQPSDSILSIGDGFINLEKYRGFYTEIDSGHESGIINYKRLSPDIRHIFAAGLEDTSLYIDSLARGDSLNFLVSIMDSALIAVHKLDLDENILAMKKVLHENFLSFFTFRLYALSPQRQNVFYYNQSDTLLNRAQRAYSSYSLNSRMRYIQNSQDLFCIWNYHLKRIPDYLRAINWATNTNGGNLLTLQTGCNWSDVMVYDVAYRNRLASIVLASSNGSYPIENAAMNTHGIPANTFLCLTFANSEKFVSTDIQGNVNIPFLRQIQASNLGHELGHFVGMLHDTTNTTSLMYPEFFNIGSGTPNPSLYLRSDFNHLRLSNSPNYRVNPARFHN